VKSRPTLNEALFSVRALRPIAARLAVSLVLWSNACAYAAALALLASIPACTRPLKPLAAVGRMPLTTYLTQSLISVTLFYN
jgi:uncharacterized membrane protein YeiB